MPKTPNARRLSPADPKRESVLIARRENGRFTFALMSKDEKQVQTLGNEMTSEEAIHAAITMIRLVVQSVPDVERDSIMAKIRERLPELFNS